MNDLFASDTDLSHQPLAARMRPATLDDYVGQSHLVGAGKPLRRAVEQRQLHSMILWGPPGTGKTTLALILAQAVDARSEEHTSELQSRPQLVCRLLLDNKK